MNKVNFITRLLQLPFSLNMSFIKYRNISMNINICSFGKKFSNLVKKIEEINQLFKLRKKFPNLDRKQREEINNLKKNIRKKFLIKSLLIQTRVLTKKLMF